VGRVGGITPTHPCRTIGTYLLERKKAVMLADIVITTEVIEVTTVIVLSILLGFIIGVGVMFRR
jgi:hypothetical protein